MLNHTNTGALSHDRWCSTARLGGSQTIKYSTGQYSKRVVARVVGVSRRTVDRALEADRLPKYHRAATGSSFDVFTAQVWCCWPRRRRCRRRCWRSVSVGWARR